MADVTGDIGGNPVELNNAATETTLKQLLAAMLAMVASGKGDKGGKGGKNFKELEKELKRLADQSKQAREEIEKLTKAEKKSREEKEKEIKAAEELIKAKEAEQKRIEANAIALGAMAGAAMQAASKLTDMISSLAGVGNSLEQAASSLRQIPVVGGFLAGMFGAVAGAASQTYKSFQQASTVGANFGGSIEDMIDSATGAGLTFDQFSGIISKNSEALVLLGGSTSEGAKRMAELGKAVRTTAKPLGDDLARLGYSTEQINEGFAKYGAMQAKSGSLQKLSNDQLITQTGDYLKNLDAVSKLTGKSKDALQAEEDARRRDAQFRIAERSIRQEDRKNVDAFMNALPSKDMQDAFKEMLATGALTGPAAQKLAAAAPEMANSLLAAAQQAKRSGNFSRETAGQLDKTLKNQAQTLAQSGRLNVFGAYLADQYGETVNGVLDYAARQSDLNETMKKNADEEEAARKKAIEAVEKGLDPASMKAYQERIAEVSNQFTKLLATSGLLEGMMKVFEGLVKFVGTFVVPAFQFMGDYAGILGIGLGAMAAVVGLVNAQLAYNNFMEKMRATTIGQSILTSKAEIAQRLKNILTMKIFNLPITLVIAAIGGLIYWFNKAGGDISVLADGFKYFVVSLKSLFSFIKLGFATVINKISFGRLGGDMVKEAEQELADQTKERADLEKKMSDTMKKNREAAEKETAARKENTKTTKEQTEAQQSSGRDYSSPEALLRSIREQSQKEISKATEQPGAAAAKPGGIAGPAISVGPMQDQLKSQLAAQGITDPKAIANIMAQVQAESGFKPQSENLNYSGKKLFELYGAGNKGGNKVRFKTLEEAETVASKGPEAVGNVIYGGRMGNNEDEGFKYRGRGLIQLTGKDNYKKFGDMIGVDLVKNPDLANDPQIANKLAAAYFAEKQKKGVDLANITAIGKAVGYAGGADETAKRAQLAQAFMGGEGTTTPINTPATLSEEMSRERIGRVRNPKTQVTPTTQVARAAVNVESVTPTAPTAPIASEPPSASIKVATLNDVVAGLESLNNQLGQLVSLNRSLQDINQRQLSVQKSFSGDLFASI